MNPIPFFLVQNLTAGYGRHRILHDISFELQAGTLTALLGANGSGKTTLLKALCHQAPHTGDFTLQGISLPRLSDRERSRHISYIPQQSGIQISLPLLDVVMMGFNPVLGLLQRPSRLQREAARRALDRVGLGHMESADYLTLSEGQKQLCILARTLIEDTQLLLLDEPESALDFYHRRKILQEIYYLVRHNDKAALLCLHDPQLALEFCDQLLLLKEGHIIDTIRPSADSCEKIQEALQKLYGPLTFTLCTDRHGQKRPVLMSDILKGDPPCSL